MYSRILDEKTLGAVIAAAPKMEDRPEEVARKIVAELTKFSDGNVSTTGAWRIKTGDLAEWVGNTTAARAGHIAREMGLGAVRTAEGFVIFWNRAQLDILRKALGV